MPIFTPPKINYLNVKVAARCNIDCSYCYWFEDKSVYDKPKRMAFEVYDKLATRIAEQVEEYGLKRFFILFHGGEPMLWGMENFRQFARLLAERVSCPIIYSMTTNGVLVNEAWADLISDLGIAVTVSIDGPKHVHDRRRKTFTNTGTFDAAVRGFRLLKERGVRTSVLAVYDPESSADEVSAFFGDELGLKSFDVLIPEANHDKPPPFSISAYYKRLFDIWMDDFVKRGINIRSAKAFAVGAFGCDTHLESIGYGAQQTSTVLTDGSLEPLDVLRFAGDSHTKTDLNIFNNRLQDIVDEDLWRSVFNNSLNLPDDCKGCGYRDACGGGYAPHRFSNLNGYNNVSVYCRDYMEIFDHVFNRINEEIIISTKYESVSPIQLVN